MSSGKKLTQAKAFADSTGVRGFKALPENNLVTIYNPGRMELIWKIQKDNIKSLRSVTDTNSKNPTGSIQITLRKKLIGFLNTQGSVTFQSSTNEYFEDYDLMKTLCVIINSGVTYSVDINSKTDITPTQFTLNLGTTVDIGSDSPISTSGKMVCILHSIIRVNSQERSKTNDFIQNDNFDPNSMTNNTIPLGISDAVKIIYVKAFNTTVSQDPGIDITDQFSLNINSDDSLYRESTLTYNGSIHSFSSIIWKYRVMYNLQSNSPLGYFDVDSYKTLIGDEIIKYSDNPTFIASNKNEYPLFDSFDFRPSYIGGILSGVTVPEIGSTAIFDLEYYLRKS